MKEEHRSVSRAMTRVGKAARDHSIVMRMFRGCMVSPCKPQENVTKRNAVNGVRSTQDSNREAQGPFVFSISANFSQQLSVRHNMADNEFAAGYQQYSHESKIRS